MTSLEKVPLSVRVILPVLWYGFIFGLTEMPGADQFTTMEAFSDLTEKVMTNETEHGAFYWAGWLNFMFRSGAHMFMFGIQGVLLYFLVAPSFQFRLFPYLGVILLVACLGILDEYHQSFVPYRESRMVDVGKDVLGAILLIGLGLVIYPKIFVKQQK